MLGFDLMDSQAGQDIYNMGQAIGLQKGIKEMLIDALDARFGVISTDMVNQINAINDLERLKDLFKQAMRCSDLEHFKKRLLS